MWVWFFCRFCSLHLVWCGTLKGWGEFILQICWSEELCSWKCSFLAGHCEKAQEVHIKTVEHTRDHSCNFKKFNRNRELRFYCWRSLSSNPLCFYTWGLPFWVVPQLRLYMKVRLTLLNVPESWLVQAVKRFYCKNARLQDGRLTSLAQGLGCTLEIFQLMSKSLVTI